MAARFWELLAVLGTLSACGGELAEGWGGAVGPGERDPAGGLPAGSLHEEAGLTFSYVPPGLYRVGLPGADDTTVRGLAEHRVLLTRGTYVAVHEVTQALFEELMGYQPAFSTCPDCPVSNVNWHEAAAFTNALSEAAGLEPCYACRGEGRSVHCELAEPEAGPYACEGYRLPTETEWEVAARAGTDSQYSAGGDLPDESYENDCEREIALTNGELLSDYAWYCYQDRQKHPVGTLLPNAWGLHDVHGNVNEWVYDYDQDVLTPPGWRDFGTDPWGPPRGTYRVLRGGASSFLPIYLTSFAREGRLPSSHEESMGFRVARSARSGEG